MLTDQDKISLITSIYQSGSNVSQFLSDLKLLSEVLDGPKKKSAPIDPVAQEILVPTATPDQKTKTIISNWKTALAASDPETPNPSLLKFQEEFLIDNAFQSTEKANHKFYLTARSVGITSAFAIHTARSLIEQPNMKIWYVAESNEGIDAFCNGVFALLPKDLIDSKSEKTLKLTNGSYVNFITQPALTNGFKETNGTTAQRVAQYISRWSVPDILLIDDAESVSFTSVTLLLGFVRQCPNVIIAGGVSDTQGLPYCIMADAKNLWIEKRIIPWYEGSLTDQDFIKSCLSTDQYLESQLCQFPRKPNEIIMESKLTNAYNSLVNIIFAPTVVDDQPDMKLRQDSGLPPLLESSLINFKNKFLTPWMYKIGEINESSEVEIIEEIDKNTGRRIFKISVGDIPPERIAEILEKAASNIEISK